MGSQRDWDLSADDRGAAALAPPRQFTLRFLPASPLRSPVSRNVPFWANSGVGPVGLGLGRGAVPSQVQLFDIPLELSDALHGYNCDKYVVMRDQMIIVDSQAHRVVAVIPAQG